MPLSPGDKLGPYELLAPIGEGGMGEVWKARDPRLNRIVAIKRLKGKHTARFEQEAHAIAALNHANICQIYDIGPDYLVMEFVEGKPLVSKEKPEPLPIEDALRLAGQIAGALEEAHSKGILHRDLKPANILVTNKGSAKLLDFGLAKLMSDAGTDATQTLDGTVLGTPAYMAPEQADGKPLDARSDIFSFGAVLYEMLSGKRAFGGASMVQVLSAVLRDEPALLQSPAAGIVKRCLAKQPAQRFQTIAEVRAALQQVMVKPVEKQPSIAVLPFADRSAGKDHEWFSDGIAEEIINVLAHIPGLTVIARTSAFAFRGKEQDITKIAEALRVSTILEGSVRRSGNRIRVTAQLIEAEKGSHLWSERYDREMTDVFAVQDEIAAAIAGVLQVKLDVAPAAARRYTPNLPAYEAYLKGRYHWAKFTPESFARSRECFEQAIALDPGFALAYIGLADYFLALTDATGLLPAHEAMPQMRALAQKALDIDSTLPEAQAMMGIVSGLYDYDWKNAERFFRLATAGDPVPAQVRQLYGYFYLLPLDRPANAVEELERAIGADPLNLMYRVVLVVCLAAAGRHEDALMESQRILDLDEYSGTAALAFAYSTGGMFPEALPLCEKVSSLMPWHKYHTAGFAVALRRTGNAARAEEVLQPLRNAPEAYGAPRALAIVHFQCGEVDQAADWLEKAIQQRDVLCPQLLAFFRSRSSSPRWPKLAKLMNLPETP